MYQRIMRLVFLGLVLANILFVVSVGLKRDEVAALSGLNVHGVTERGESDAGLLVLVGEDAGVSAAAGTTDEAYLAAVGTLPEPRPVIEEHVAIPLQARGLHERGVAPDAAASAVTAAASPAENRDFHSNTGSVALGGVIGSEVATLDNSDGVPRAEAAETPTRQSNEVTGQLSPDAGSAVEHPSACVRIGPFAERPDVGRLLTGLSDAISAGEPYTAELVDRPIFWVHVSPLGSSEEAQEVQKDLAARGIASFVISDLGPLHNGVSLGVFRDPDSARRLATSMAGIGYAVATHESLGKRAVHFARIRVPAEHAQRLVDTLASRAGIESAGASASAVECDEGFNARVASTESRD